MPELNKGAIGKTYPSSELAVDGKMSKYYALAANDPNPWYLDESREGGIVAPPMYAVAYAGGSFAQVFFDKEIGEGFMAMLVHGEQDMVWHRLPKPGEAIMAQGKVKDIEDKGSGELLVVEVNVTAKGSGEKLVTLTFGFFVRGWGKMEKKGKTAEPEEDRSKKAFSSKEHVILGQTYAYAEPSGDHNPIHKDVEFAKKVGLGGIILQGLCTMAFMQKAVINNVCGGDPRKLHRLFVRFSKPVRPGDDLSIEGWYKDKNVVAFEAMNQKGEFVIKNGIAELNV